MSELDKITYLQQHKPSRIVGVLILNSKHKYGKKKRKDRRSANYYLFRPFDNNFPSFKVASKIKGENEYIIIKPLLNKDFSEIPFGENLGHKIGKVSDLESIKKAYYFYYNLDFKKCKELVPKWNHWPVENKNKIISIDPKGCIDIDDAVSYGGNILKIYLADTTLITEKILEHACEQCTTVYTKEKIQHMLPEKMMKLCSLLEGQIRRANVCEIRINEQYEIKDYKFYQEIIQVNKNYSYVEADTLNDPYIEKIMYIVEQINFSYAEQEGSRSHKVIEKLMVMVNSLVVKKLLETKKQFIIRKHSSSKIEKKNVPAIFSSFYNIYTSNSAEYALYDEKSEHSGLNIKQYTHFTSPLRRLVDLINHLILFTDKKLTDEELLNICNNCNDINKRIKRYDIECQKLDLLTDDGENDYDITYKGYIIDFIERDNLPIKIKFYLPDLRIVLSQEAFNNKLKTLYKTELTENKLKIVKDNEQIEYEIFQEISVSLHKRPDEINPNRKLKFEIF